MMKITVVNGTEVKGCTYHIKESFLDSLRDSSEIMEFYLPKALPQFCLGCKTVFWNELSDKKRKQITGKTGKLARKYRNASPARGGIKTGLLFALTRAMHQSFARKEKILSADNRHWLHMGWIKL